MGRRRSTGHIRSTCVKKEVHSTHKAYLSKQIKRGLGRQTTKLCHPASSCVCARACVRAQANTDAVPLEYCSATCQNATRHSLNRSFACTAFSGSFSPPAAADILATTVLVN